MTQEIELHTANCAMIALASYRPPDVLAPETIWPPRFRCWGWNNYPSRHALPYARLDMGQLLSVLRRERIKGGTVVLTRHLDGFPNLFWGQRFDHVVAIHQDQIGRSPLRDGRHEIQFGFVDDARFMYRLVPSLSDVRAVIYDDDQYNRLIAPYFLLRSVMRRRGIMVFTRASAAGVRRFLQDLGRGFLDNRTHEIVDCSSARDGPGTAYELIDASSQVSAFDRAKSCNRPGPSKFRRLLAGSGDDDIDRKSCRAITSDV